MAICFNAHRKDMNFSFLLPDISEIIRHSELFSSGDIISLRDGKKKKTLIKNPEECCSVEFVAHWYTNLSLLPHPKNLSGYALLDVV